MIGNEWLLVLAIATLGGGGVFLLLPQGNTIKKLPGAILCMLALACLWMLWAQTTPTTNLTRGIVFTALASFTLIGAVNVVTQANPVASALWFTCVVVGTAGLFLTLNAQFLAAATVIVYAGAIIVMFLFVVMLAQQRGVETHDVWCRQPHLAVAVSSVLLVLMLASIVATEEGGSPIRRVSPRPVAAASASPSLTAATDPPNPSVAPPVVEHWDTRPGSPQSAALGRALFAKHWLSIEVAGTLLLVALVGAIVIVARREPAKPKV